MQLGLLYSSYKARTTPGFEEGQQYDVDFRRIGGQIARDPLDSAETAVWCLRISRGARVRVSTALAQR